MQVDIPEPIVYMVAGAIVDRIVQKICGNSIRDVVSYVLNNINKQQRLKEIEARRVVDIMGNTLGYIDNKGNITKGDLNDC